MNASEQGLCPHLLANGSPGTAHTITRMSNVVPITTGSICRTRRATYRPKVNLAFPRRNGYGVSLSLDGDADQVQRAAGRHLDVRQSLGPAGLLGLVPQRDDRHVVGQQLLGRLVVGQTGLAVLAVRLLDQRVELLV